MERLWQALFPLSVVPGAGAWHRLAHLNLRCVLVNAAVQFVYASALLLAWRAWA